MLRIGTELRGLQRGLLVFAGLALAAISVARAGGGQPDADFQAQLAAGEFAPALAGRPKVANPQQRDAALAQVAAAQAQAGAPDAAVATVAQVGDDRARAHILAQPGGNGANGNNANGNNKNNGADFQPLMDLIQNTVATKSWIDNGGNGTISDFPTGVSVDPSGVLRPLMREARSGDLAALRTASLQRAGQDDVRRSSPLRMISLTRLEKQIELNAAVG